MLEKLRKSIDKIDRKILKLMEDRFKVTNKIGKYKKKHNIPIQNKKREQEIIRERQKESKLDKNFIRNFYFLLFKESRRQQAR
jgi:chorismate mutase